MLSTETIISILKVHYTSIGSITMSLRTSLFMMRQNVLAFKLPNVLIMPPKTLHYKSVKKYLAK